MNIGHHWTRCGASLLVLTVLLVACASLPHGAKKAVLRTFDSEEQPRIHSARRVDPLPEDLKMGVSTHSEPSP